MRRILRRSSCARGPERAASTPISSTRPTTMRLDSDWLFFNVEGLSSDPRLETAMSMLIATAMSARATGKTGRPSITVLDECWFLLDSPALAPEVVQLFRTARKRNSSVWGISQTVEDFVGTESQPRVHGPGILKNASTKIIGQQPGDVAPLITHLYLNPVAVGQVKEFGAPRKGRSAEVLLVIGEKAETTQTIRIVPTPLSYWICTTFPRERKYRSWFLEEHYEPPIARILSGARQEVSPRTGGRGPTARGIVGRSARSPRISPGNRPRNSYVAGSTRHMGGFENALSHLRSFWFDVHVVHGQCERSSPC